MKIPLREYWILLVKYLRPQWPWVALLAILLFGSIGLQLLLPQITRNFIDTALAGAALDTLVHSGLFFIGVALLHQVVSVSATYASERVGWRATNALRSDLARHCLRLDMSFHNAHTPGEMIERIDGDVMALTNFFSRFVIQISGNLLLLIAFAACCRPGFKILVSRAARRRSKRGSQRRKTRRCRLLRARRRLRARVFPRRSRPTSWQKRRPRHRSSRPKPRERVSGGTCGG